MFNEDEIVQLKDLFKKFTRTVEFTLRQTQENEFGRKLESVVSAICDHSEGKCVTVPDTSDFRTIAAPCFKIGADGNANIAYAALPTGHQFSPFLKILERIGCGDCRVAKDVSSSDQSKAELIILISDSCPRCPLVVEAAGMTACEHPSILSSFVDVMQFKGFVKEYGIKSVPATILDRKIVLIGAVSAGRIMELVESRGTPKFEIEVVRSLIEMSKIPEAAEHLNSDAGRSVVLDYMQDTEFSKRLSALVVVEKALEDNPDTVRAMVPSLLPLLAHSDSRIRGDVADLLGKIGDPQVLPHLESLTSDPDPDVVEAAEDAIEELKKN